MEKREIKRILTAPITLLRWSTKEERALFPSEDIKGCFCTFGLASGQTFVAHIPEKDGIFTFKTYQNLLPNLTAIEWKRAKDIADLGYVTTCYTSAAISNAEMACYKNILMPKPDKSTKHPLTKIGFKYYKYHPLLQRARSIQSAVEDYRKKEQELITSQRRLGVLVFSDSPRGISPFGQRVRTD